MTTREHPMTVAERPLFRLARDLLERRNTATGSNRESAQGDLDAALDAIDEQVDAQLAALPRPTVSERFPHWVGR